MKLTEGIFLLLNPGSDGKSEEILPTSVHHLVPLSGGSSCSNAVMTPIRRYQYLLFTNKDLGSISDSLKRLKIEPKEDQIKAEENDTSFLKWLIFLCSLCFLCLRSS